MIQRLLDRVNRIIVAIAGVALVAAGAVLSYSVVVRYFLRLPTDWEDETAIFLLVGTVFLSSAQVQNRRGHIGIEALIGLLPPRLDRMRLRIVDFATALFCAFFAWKSWTLFREAWVDHQTTDSSWGPPLWIPYLTMASGMSLLTLQVLLQTMRGKT